MNNLNCQASIDVFAPVDAQNQQNEVPTINVDQLQEDLQFEATLCDEVPEEVLQTDNRGNICNAPTVSYSTDPEQFINPDTGKAYTPNHCDLVNALKRRFNLCRMLGDVCLYDIRTKQYVFGQKAFEDLIAFIYPQAKINERKEAYAFAMLPSMLEERKEAPPWYLHFANCVVDTKTKKIYKPNPAFYILNNIPYDFNPDAKSKAFDDFISAIACEREEVIHSLHELLALIMYRSYPSAVVKFYNTDRRENASGGKTTALEVFAHMVTGDELTGSPNYTTLSDAQLASKFNRSNIGIALMNAGDENEQPEKQSQRDAVATFKKNVSTGFTFQGDVKQQQANKPIVPRCIFIDTSNELDRQAHDDGTERRIFYIPFNAHFSPTDENYDPFIRQKLNCLEVWQTMANYAVNTLYDMGQKGAYEFTPTEDNERAKEAARITDIPIKAWMHELNLSKAVLTYRGRINPFVFVDGEMFANELEKVFAPNDGKLYKPRVMSEADWRSFFKIWCKVNNAGEGFRAWKTDLENKLHLFVHKTTIKQDGKTINKRILAFKADFDEYQHAAEVVDRYGNAVRGKEAASDLKELLPFITDEEAKRIQKEIEEAGFDCSLEEANENEKEVLTSKNEENNEEVIACDSDNLPEDFNALSVI